jgi:hypothetical protein
MPSPNDSLSDPDGGEAGRAAEAGGWRARRARRSSILTAGDRGPLYCLAIFDSTVVCCVLTSRVSSRLLTQVDANATCCPDCYATRRTADDREVAGRQNMVGVVETSKYIELVVQPLGRTM